MSDKEIVEHFSEMENRLKVTVEKAVGEPFGGVTDFLDRFGGVIQEQLDRLEKDQQNLAADIAELNARVGRLEASVADLNARAGRLEVGFEELDGRANRLELGQLLSATEKGANAVLENGATV